MGFYIIILDSSVPSRKKRAFESLSGEDQSCGEDGAMASLCSNGRCLKLHHGDAEVFPTGGGGGLYRWIWCRSRWLLQQLGGSRLMLV
jgi:hypothetical protein